MGRSQHCFARPARRLSDARNRRLNLWFAVTAIPVAVAAVALTLFFHAPPLLSVRQPQVAPATVVQGEVLVPLREVVQLNPTFLRVGGTQLFVMKDENDRPRAALDRCKTCPNATFMYVGEELHCDYCGEVVELIGWDSTPQECRPIAVPTSVRGDMLIIKTADLAERGSSARK
jgi:uncharacterized membrane protein